MNTLWLAVAVLVVALAVLRVRSAFDPAETVKRLAAIRALPHAEAKRIAWDLLTKPGFFETRPARSTFNNPDIPEDVRAIFSRFDRVTRGDFWIGPAEVKKPARLPGYFRIGECDDMELLVLSRDARIHLSFAETANSPACVEIEPSIWHELIVISGAAADGA